MVVVGARSAATGRGGAAPDLAPSGAAPADLPAGATARPPSESLALENADCTFEDRGYGDYEKGSAKPFVVYARSAAIRPDGRYDLVLHAHGGDAARRLLLPRGYDLNVATLDRGALSSAYKGSFPTRHAFDDAIAGIDRAVSELTRTEARAERIVLSSFSAGYAASGEALAALGESSRPSGVILLDSLHAGYGRGKTVNPTTLEPFLSHARAALEGRGFFGLTHSAVAPPDYASTAEVGSYFLEVLRVDAEPVDAAADGALRLSRVAHEKGFVLRGYTGTDRGSHCAQLGLLPELVEAWQRSR